MAAGFKGGMVLEAGLEVVGLSVAIPRLLCPVLIP